MIFNLNQNSQINVREDTRGPKASVTVSATSTVSVALAANASRANYSIYNAGPDTVFVREGVEVTDTLYDVQLPPGFYWKEDFNGTARYLGEVSVITAGAGTASLQVSEGTLL